MSLEIIPNAAKAGAAKQERQFVGLRSASLINTHKKHDSDHVFPAAGPTEKTPAQHKKSENKDHKTKPKTEPPMLAHPPGKSKPKHTTLHHYVVREPYVSQVDDGRVEQEEEDDEQNDAHSTYDLSALQAPIVHITTKTKAEAEPKAEPKAVEPKAKPGDIKNEKDDKKEDKMTAQQDKENQHDKSQQQQQQQEHKSWSWLDDVGYLRQLGIYPHLRDIFGSIMTKPVTLVSAPTGTGKTIGIPHMLLWAMAGRLIPTKRVFVAVPYATIVDMQFRHSSKLLTEICGQDRKKLSEMMFYLSANGGELKTTKEKQIDEHPQIVYGTYKTIKAHLEWLWGKKSPLLNQSIVMMDEVHQVCDELSQLMSWVQKITLDGFAVKTVMASATPYPSIFEKLHVPDGDVICCSVDSLPVCTHWLGEGEEGPNTDDTKDKKDVNNNNQDKVTQDIFVQWRPNEFIVNFQKIKSAVMRTLEKIRDKQTTPAYKDKQNKDILIFVSGELEVEELCAEIMTRKDLVGPGGLGGEFGLVVMPFFGKLDKKERLLVFVDRDKMKPRRSRKIIVTTNGLESGVTINGVGYVIDALSHKTHVTKDGYTKIVETLVSVDMACQRKGRVGRIKDVHPDHCYRLCTKHFFENELPNTRHNPFQSSKKTKLVLRYLKKGYTEADIIQLLNTHVVPHGDAKARMEYDCDVAELERLQLIFGDRNAGFKVNSYGQRVMYSPLSVEGASILEWCSDEKWDVQLTPEKLLHLLISVVGIEVNMSHANSMWRFPSVPKEFLAQTQTKKEPKQMESIAQAQDDDDEEETSPEENFRQKRTASRANFLLEKQKQFGGSNDLVVAMKIFGHMMASMTQQKVNVFNIEQKKAENKQDDKDIKDNKQKEEKDDTTFQDDEEEAGDGDDARVAHDWWRPCGEWSRIHGVDNKAAVAFYHLWKTILGRMAKAAFWNTNAVFNELLLQTKQNTQRALFDICLLSAEATNELWLPLWSFVFENKTYDLASSNKNYKNANQPLLYVASQGPSQAKCRIDNKSIALLGSLSINDVPSRIVALKQNSFMIRDKQFEAHFLTTCFPYVA